MSSLSLEDCIRRLIDLDTFEPLSPMAAADSIVAGFGTIGGRTVAAAAIGAFGPLRPGRPDRPLGREKLLRFQERAAEALCPVVYIFRPNPADGPDAAETQDAEQLDDPNVMATDRRGIGRFYAQQIGLSGLVPQVGVVLGHLGGPRAFPAALCDALVFGPAASVSLGTAQQALDYFGERTTLDEIGAASMHCETTGMGDAITATEEDAIHWARGYLGYMPQHRGASPPISPVEPAIEPSPDALPGAGRDFEIRKTIAAIVDQDSTFELKRGYAPELLTAFARLGGRPIGLIANNARHRAGMLFVESCDKAVRFITICDAFRIPMVFLGDSPGFMIGRASEQAGIVRAAAKLFTAVSVASVPKYTVVVRKLHTATINAMCGPPFDPELFVAIEGASLSLLAPEAVQRVSAKDPKMAAFYERMLRLGTPSRLAAKLIVDSVVPLTDVRDTIMRRLDRDCEIASRRAARAARPPLWPM